MYVSTSRINVILTQLNINYTGKFSMYFLPKFPKNPPKQKTKREIQPDNLNVF